MCRTLLWRLSLSENHCLKSKLVNDDEKRRSDAFWLVGDINEAISRRRQIGDEVINHFLMVFSLVVAYSSVPI